MQANLNGAHEWLEYHVLTDRLHAGPIKGCQSQLAVLEREGQAQDTWRKPVLFQWQMVRIPCTALGRAGADVQNHRKAQ